MEKLYAFAVLRGLNVKLDQKDNTMLREDLFSTWTKQSLCLKIYVLFHLRNIKHTEYGSITKTDLYIISISLIKALSPELCPQDT